ncbi:hypothetical protein Sm713_00020 [Streptomyces sp. TS71-3]|nr:hypothetical protein Sm713_00020 [Streptomyces sp. TS71-3]
MRACPESPPASTVARRVTPEDVPGLDGSLTRLSGGADVTQLTHGLREVTPSAPTRGAGNCALSPDRRKAGTETARGPTGLRQGREELRKHPHRQKAGTQTERGSTRPDQGRGELRKHPHRQKAGTETASDPTEPRQGRGELRKHPLTDSRNTTRAA